MLYRIDEPNILYMTTLSGILSVRKYLLRYLALPRPYFMRQRWFSDHPDPETGEYHPARSIALPWYMKPTVSSRWGPMAWLSWFCGKPLPGDEGEKYHPDGYHLAEMGPVTSKGKGAEEMKMSRSGIASINARTCPFGP